MRRMHLARLGLVGSVLSLAVFAAGCATTTESHTTHVAVGQKASTARAPHAVPAAPTLSPEDAWQRLRAGNTRFVDGRVEHPNQSFARRVEVAGGQRPYAIVLSCSDSRVPPEIVFDTGLGDIFVIRVAGNTADDAVIASMEYAVEHLHVPLIVVLGHQRCGAVQAAVEAADSHERAPGHLSAILDPIGPAVQAARGQGGDTVENAIQENVLLTVHQLTNCQPILVEAVRAHHLGILGARYDLDSGQVTAVKQPQAVTAGH